MPGTLIQVSTSPGGMPKFARPAAVVTVDGVAEDWQRNRKYHGGRDRAVCLFSVEMYDRLRREYGVDLPPGSVGENVTTAGIDLDALRAGDVLRVGADCRIRIIDVRDPCRSLHRWDPRLMKAMVGHSGWVCRVLAGGTVRPGDVVVVESSDERRAMSAKRRAKTGLPERSDFALRSSLCAHRSALHTETLMYTPTVEQLRDLYEYMAWGDRRSIEVARSVPADGFTLDQGISAGSVHKLLAHMLGSQVTWLARWHGSSPARLADHTDFPDLASIEARWPAVHAEQVAFVTAQTPATLAAPLHYSNTRGDAFSLPLGQVLLHVADHATYHRGQLNSMAKRAGGTPLPIMRFTWVIERSAER